MLKKIVLGIITTSSLVVAASSATAAAKTGVYVGAQAGYGYSDLKDLSGDQTPSSLEGYTVKTHKGGFDGRAYLGYRVNQYFGLEMGAEYLPHSNYELQLAGSAGSQPKITLDQYAFDLLAKAYIPFNDQFFAFGGAGAAYVLNKYELTGGDIVEGSQSNDYKGYVRPKVTAGLGYNVNSNIALTVGYGHIFGNRTGSELLEGKRGVVDINTFTAGVEYTF